MKTITDREMPTAPRDPASPLPRLATLAAVVLAGAAICAARAGTLYWFWHGPWLKLYSVLATAFILSRLVIATRYREPADRGYFPTVSVVISVMNEEDQIAQTIEHCFASRYPAERLEVIAIDDGSTDGTWAELVALRDRYPRLRTIKFDRNHGKREGMGAGTLAASGDVLVFVDSDTFVAPDGIYKLVQPLADPAVGAVAGHITINVDPDSFISKMESVRYFISHRLLKAAEAVFDAVTCCPGPFSAYRRETVMSVLDPWLGQEFLGVRATFGDDRSLTNFVLRHYKVVFHDGARCATTAPETWPKFFKQQLRWKKSWMRETTVASRFMWREHPVAALSYYTGVLLTILSPLTVLHALVYTPLLAKSIPVFYLLGLLLAYLFLSLISLYLTRTRYWYFGLAFAWLYVFVLSWQNYYALLTVNRTTWGTR